MWRHTLTQDGEECGNYRNTYHGEHGLLFRRQQEIAHVRKWRADLDEFCEDLEGFKSKTVEQIEVGAWSYYITTTGCGTVCLRSMPKWTHYDAILFAIDDDNRSEGHLVGRLAISRVSERPSYTAVGPWEYFPPTTLDDMLDRYARPTRNLSR